MTDYNDGNWHGWNGGSCPVHPHSEVQTIWHMHMPDSEAYGSYQAAAGETVWSDVIRFRVITPYVDPPKPREFWINEYPSGVLTCHNSEKHALLFGGKLYHCIEVLK